MVAGLRMIRKNLSLLIYVGAAFFSLQPTAVANTYDVVVKGKVTMEDGTPPPFAVAVERLCSDSPNGTPGPLVSKKGDWIWKLQIDAFAQRACTFRAVIKGYTSTEADASHINVTSRDTTFTVPTIVLMAATPDPAALRFNEGSIPPKAKSGLTEAMKAMDAHDYQETRKGLVAAVTAAPKFAQGWHALGVVNDNLAMEAEARDAFTHAIDADPKIMPSYVMLARICIKMKDWQCALQTSDSLLKIDIKHVYPEVYVHRAVAQYQLHDLPGAQMSIEEALRLDPGHKRPRAEYVQGRILEAKGDMNGAREHMSKYLAADPNAADADVVKAHVQLLGQNTGTEPDLELF
jgi:Tfp pilus assembly protein PilF